jgi:hypothetical protein
MTINMLTQFKRFLTPGTLLTIMTFIASCDETNKHIVDQYFITNFDGERSLTFRLNNGDYIDVVKPSVFELTHDKSFILVKQHPQNFSTPPNEP